MSKKYILVMDPMHGAYLEHRSHKYIKRWWKNGKWHYTYSKSTGISDISRYKYEWQNNSGKVSNARQQYTTGSKAYDQAVKEMNKQLDYAGYYNKHKAELSKNNNSLAGKLNYAINYKTRDKKSKAAESSAKTYAKKASELDSKNKILQKDIQSSSKEAMKNRYKYHQESAAAIRSYSKTPIGKLKRTINKGKNAVARLINSISDSIADKKQDKALRTGNEKKIKRDAFGNVITYSKNVKRG